LGTIKEEKRKKGGTIHQNLKGPSKSGKRRFNLIKALEEIGRRK